MAQYYSRLSRMEDRSERPTFSSIFFTRNQLPLLGLIAGVILNRTGIIRPPFFAGIFPFLVSTSAWLYLVPIGYDLDFGEMRKYWSKVTDLIPIKFILVPAALYGLALLAGLEGTKMGTVVILSFTPSAVGAVIAAKLNRLNTHLPMAAYILTTTVYMFVVFPLIIIFSP